MLLRRLNRNRASGRGLEPETHHRLVNRAYLLHIKGSVRDALAIEDELQKLIDLERGIQSELRELTGEIAPKQFEMEASLLDILDKALYAASDGQIISADDGS